MIRMLDSAGSTLEEWGRQQQQHVDMHVVDIHDDVDMHVVDMHFVDIHVVDIHDVGTIG